MSNALFTHMAAGGLLILLAAMLVFAAVKDVRTYTITNRFNLAVAALAPLFWLASGLPLWPGAGIQLGVALLVFTVAAGAFYLGMMGGGDVKLAAALALWFSPRETAQLLIIMSLMGGLLTLVVISTHRRSGAEGRPKVPYGVAIAAGAWAILAQRILNHFG